MDGFARTDLFLHSYTVEHPVIYILTKVAAPLPALRDKIGWSFNAIPEVAKRSACRTASSIPIVKVPPGIPAPSSQGGTV
jgi:hypothetical protein